MNNATQWEQMVRGYWRSPSDTAVAQVVEALVAADARGEQSSVWHEVWAWSQDHVDYPTCQYCLGPADPRIGFHNLCRERFKRDLPTPYLDVRDAHPCPCSPCCKAAAGSTH